MATEQYTQIKYNTTSQVPAGVDIMQALMTDTLRDIHDTPIHYIPVQDLLKMGLNPPPVTAVINGFAGYPISEHLRLFQQSLDQSGPCTHSTITDFKVIDTILRRKTAMQLVFLREIFLKRNFAFKTAHAFFAYYGAGNLWYDDHYHDPAAAKLFWLEYLSVAPPVHRKMILSGLSPTMNITMNFFSDVISKTQNEEDELFLYYSEVPMNIHTTLKPLADSKVAARLVAACIYIGKDKITVESELIQRIRTLEQRVFLLEAKDAAKTNE